MKNGQLPKSLNGSTLPLVIHFAPGVREFLEQTVCRFEPEHTAILAVNPEEPLRVVEAHPIAPKNGNASRTHIQLDDKAIEYLLNVQLLPRRLVIGGAFHTHPWGFNQLSGGIPGSGQGDVPAMRAALERAQAMGMPGQKWTDFLAPIATMDAKSWKPTFTGWVVRLDHPHPIAVKINFETETREAAKHPLSLTRPIDELVAESSHYQELINRVLADKVSPKEHRRWMADFIHQARCDDLTARLQNYKNLQSNQSET